MSATGPRCEAIVKRGYPVGTEEVRFEIESCGRLAKVVVRVGNRDVPACHVHERKLRRGLL